MHRSDALRIVAEIGLNYEGNLHLALELIRQAKMAGADAVKFQFGWRSGPGEINQIDSDRARTIRSWCDQMGIDMLASIITEEVWEWARQLDLACYKIASRTVVEKPALCEKILAEGKPTFVSLGMWDREGFPFGPPDNKFLHYIYCRSKYPTFPGDLTTMPSRFESVGYYGYSDHSLGIEACLLAIARGARYIEKHFTLNKTSQTIRDHVLSATPDELRQMAEVGRPLASLVRLIEDT